MVVRMIHLAQHFQDRKDEIVVFPVWNAPETVALNIVISGGSETVPCRDKHSERVQDDIRKSSLSLSPIDEVGAFLGKLQILLIVVVVVIFFLFFQWGIQADHASSMVTRAFGSWRSCVVRLNSTYAGLDLIVFCRVLVCEQTCHLCTQPA